MRGMVARLGRKLIVWGTKMMTEPLATTQDDPTLYLQPTFYVNSDHPAIQEWAHEVVSDATTLKEKAIRLFYDVRDRIFYNPYRIKLLRDSFQASTILQKGRTFCIPKAILMAAGARAVGVPCRLGFADVRGHLTSQSLLDALQTDVFAFHGYVELLLDGKWVRATPTFNRELCENAGVAPLEFDGTQDALFQEYNLKGQSFMEYLRFHGVFADFPHRLMLRVWKQAYPHLFEGEKALELDGDLEAELAREKQAA
jgi:transglutaminase-like putative cysteine protease